MTQTSAQWLEHELLYDIAEGLARSVSADQLPAGSQRRWVRLLATHSYEAWLIGWPPGTGLELHDHGESSAGLCVVSGVLEERHVLRHSWGQAVTRRLVAGDTVAFDSAHVHAVRNDGDIEALSVHVYSPPLAAMTFFEEGEGTMLRPVDAPLVDHAPLRRASVVV